MDLNIVGGADFLSKYDQWNQSFDPLDAGAQAFSEEAGGITRTLPIDKKR